METGRFVLQEEKRIEKSKDVKIVFVDGLFEDFNVIDDEGNLKYCGKVQGKEYSSTDYCTCQSYYHSNTKSYQDEHGYNFQCKHIIKARSLRFVDYP